MLELRGIKKMANQMKEFIATKTRFIRHGIIKFLAPNVYQHYVNPLRPMIRYVRTVFGNKPLVGVEIGVAFGENAKRILHALNMKMLYLVDPYVPYDDGFTSNTEFLLRGLGTVKRELAPLPNVTFIRKKSEDAVNDIPNEIDFCYIDGNHSYEFVKKDIEMYYPKIKKGGVIGGHDFSAHFPEVCKAIIEFVQNTHLKLYGDNVDWWVVKS